MIGLGTIVAGGGVAMGSGAFSTANATRELEVNVVTQTDIAADFVDIILKEGGHNSVVVGDASSPTDTSSLFPDSSNSYGSSGYSPADSDVSLMQNNVKIVFGPDGDSLPPNSTVSYSNLFEVVNDDGTSAQDFDVTFESSGGPSLEFNGDSESQSSSYTASVTSSTTEKIDVDVTTAESDVTGSLDITITESN